MCVCVCVCVRSVQCGAAGQSVRCGRPVSSSLQHSVHEWSGPGRDLCCSRNALLHLKWVTQQQHHNNTTTTTTKNWQSNFRCLKRHVTRVSSSRSREQLYIWQPRSRVVSSALQVTQRATRRRRWDTSSRRVWPRWGRCCVTCCCHTWWADTHTHTCTHTHTHTSQWIIHLYFDC